MTRDEDLEVRFAWLVAASVVGFGVLLAAGLVLHITEPGSMRSSRILSAGLIVLMVTPAVRLGLAVAERIRRGDWPFVVMTAAVVVELAIVMWRASLRM